MPTSSMPEILLTPSFFKENWSFLSSAVAVLCTTFFFLRALPYRDIHTNMSLCKPPVLNSFIIFCIYHKLWAKCGTSWALKLMAVYSLCILVHSTAHSNTNYRYNCLLLWKLPLKKLVQSLMCLAALPDVS